MIYSAANAKYWIHNVRLQVNPYSAACTDEMNSASDIQDMEAKNEI